MSADTLPVVQQGAARPAARLVAPNWRPNFLADSLVLDKSARRLTLFFRGRAVRRYSVALGSHPVGDKKRIGDGRTPEGLYYINGRNARSKYHLALRISYPHTAQQTRAAQRGVSPGGNIMIHGLPREFATVGALHRQQDWTKGCIAVTNEEIEEIWRAVPNGARILITP
jgi:murein L,D-transpeptidase YafK